MHLDDERIQRLLHVELDRAREEETRAHLVSCTACRRRVERARLDESELERRLAHLDLPAAALDLDAIVARAHAPEHAPGARLLQRAAGFVAVLALAGAAYAVYAMPGSPVRTWVASVAERWFGAPHSRPPNETPADSGAAGIAVVPGPVLLIVFTTPGSDGVANVVLTDGAEVAVHAPSGAATYTVDGPRLVIDNHGVATFSLEIPRTAPYVEVRVGDVPLFLKDGTRVTTLVSPDTTSPYRLSLRP